MPRIENCTADPRTLCAPLPVGLAKLSLKPGEVSKDLSQEVIDILKANPAVELLFRNKLVRIAPDKSKVDAPVVASSAPVDEAKPKPKKKGKGRSKSKLDLEV
jgi:hypothetical protein